ncbi:MAG: LytTR family transcriptional regulator [Erysipelotrichaceae bacterium]|nr:LytTR family transcriptional regulator [Erysipelotrichaceae bacterium]
MKVEVKLIDSTMEESALINVHSLGENISMAIELLENNKNNIIGIKDGKSYVIDITKIYYIEAIDNKTFIYLKDDVYESKYKLYELENVLDRAKFLRCSKSMICNIRKIKIVKTSLNGRLDATMLNDEQIVISRSYVKELKKMLGM